jgi:hypothetical protein
LNTSQLQPNPFSPLSLKEIRPLGWLKRQLSLQASSLSGTLDEWWPDVKESQWFGGNSDGWERAPYWLDGCIPLAHLLEDPKLITKTNDRIHQCLSINNKGWIGPGQEDESYDLWGHVPLLKSLVQLHDLTDENTYLHALHQQLLCFHDLLHRRPLSNWAHFRWFEYLIPAFYVFEKTGDTRLLDFCHTCYHQGFSWRQWFLNGGNQKRSPQKKWSFITHVVNNTMAIKEGALWYRISKDQRDLDQMMDMIRLLDQHHGQVHGMVTGDECLAGQNPIQGTELCAIVEAMYSLEHAIATTGDQQLCDTLEKITFNALPATLSEDMWTHQYDQQVNQVECSVLQERTDNRWTTNLPDSNIFGIEPNFGCCTANLSQGWPKFIAHAWMKNARGMAAITYAPTVVSTKINGIPVTLKCESDYPFRDEVKITVKTKKSSHFSLDLRIPQWCQSAQINQGQGWAPASTGWHPVEQNWQEEQVIHLKLPMQAQLERRWNNALSVVRGPLVYSVEVKSEAKTREDSDGLGLEARKDTELFSTSPWNVALPLEHQSPEQAISFKENPVQERPFQEKLPPMEAQVKGRIVKNWNMVDGSHGDMPESPVPPSALGEEVDLRLIPYGCSKLRLTEIPSYE